MAFRLPKISLNRDWLVLGGTVALAAYTAVLLHNQYGAPTVPGLYYGSGGPAIGFASGDSGAKPTPILNPAYQSVRPYTDPVFGAIHGGAKTIAGDIEGLTTPKQAMWGGFYGQG